MATVTPRSGAVAQLGIIYEWRAESGYEGSGVWCPVDLSKKTSITRLPFWRAWVGDSVSFSSRILRNRYRSVVTARSIHKRRQGYEQDGPACVEFDHEMEDKAGE